jgi:dTDP-4-amino-4,6-dideoxygalactose transaminase
MRSTNDLAVAGVPAIHGGRPLFEETFRFCRPLLPPLGRALQHYQSAYASGTITNANLVEHLEAAVAERLEVKHCVAVSSCTSGLMLVLRALGVTGEVIVPSFTFFATGHAVLWNGLRPVFADCDEETWNVDPIDVERKITERTSAILAVHLYGNPCDIEGLTQLASRHRLKLIFDAAHSFGSQYRGRSIGQFGDAEIFSLSPTKLLVAGEGGLIATNDASLALTLRAMRNYGDTGDYNPKWLGMNARLSEFNAALALAGLSMTHAKIRRRNRIAQMYTDLLSLLPGLGFQRVHAQDVSTYKDYSVHVTAETFGLPRDELAAALSAENIQTKKYFYPPLHKQRLYTAFYDPTRDNLSHTDFVADGILSLPMFESIPDATVEKIAHAIQRLAKYGTPHKSSSRGRSYRRAASSS